MSIWNGRVALACTRKRRRQGLIFTKKVQCCQLYAFLFFQDLGKHINHSMLFYRYQNRFRPTYKIAFKTVTELEWRCCPGYQGRDCKDLKPPPHRQTVPEIQPYLLPNPGHTTRHTQSNTVFYVRLQVFLSFYA